jgi:hypothetical protein
MKKSTLLRFLLAKFSKLATHLDRGLAVAMDILEELEEVQLGPISQRRYRRALAQVREKAPSTSSRANQQGIEALLQICSHKT